jgi:hypothetical protein
MLPCLMPLPREIAEKGDGIYKAKYKRIYEKRFFGQYVAIDLETGEAFVAPNAAAAIQSAQTTSKEGALFHLIRIGSQTGASSR